MPDFLTAPVQTYLDQLASGEPTPGGGSAAGLAGAMGASLLCMVARFTVGRERYNQYQEAACMVLTVAEGLRAELQRLIEEDAAAYGLYGAALALPKATDEEKTARRHAIQAATRASAQPPMAIARHCYQILDLARVLASNCNPYLVSDVAVAVHLALGAFESAVLNVRLNLKSLDDTEFVSQLSGELAPMIVEGPRLADAALTTAYDIMKLTREGV